MIVPVQPGIWQGPPDRMAGTLPGTPSDPPGASGWGGAAVTVVSGGNPQTSQ